MLFIVSIGICWVAVMAPALTEAANQAEEFKLPSNFSPTPSDLDFNPLTLKVDLLECKGPPLNFSYMTLSKLGESYKADRFDSNLRIKENLTEGTRATLKWDETKRKIHRPTRGTLLNVPFNGRKAKVTLGTAQNPINKRQPLGVATQTGVLHPQGHLQRQNTMNKNSVHLTPQSSDAMGLINASLESELKGRGTEEPSERSAFSSHEQMLLFSDPEKQDRCAHVDLDDEQLPSEISQALLKKLVNNGSATETVEKSEGFSEWTVPKKDLSVEGMEHRYSVLRHRAACFMRRIRKLQIKHTEGHMKEQLRVFADNSKKRRVAEAKTALQTYQSRARKAEEVLHSKYVQSLSTTSLVELVKDIETPHLQSSSIRAGGDPLDFLDQSSSQFKSDPNQDITREVLRTARTLKGAARFLESAVADSDATESSSGGESGDEAPSMDPKSSRPCTLHKRAYWRWTLDRAAVATRWVWLQAQVSDLEYKIRQQNEVYRQLRLSKGNVSLQEPSNLSKSVSSSAGSPSSRFHDDLLIGASETRTECNTTTKHEENHLLTSCLANNKTVNGFRPSERPGNSFNGQNGEANERTSNGVNCCSRTRALRSLRKRKLVRTVGLHLINRRGSKLSSVRCHCNCQRELTPCITCGGRYHSVQSLDAEVMPLNERVSLLDSSFHPRLSFKHDTLTGIQYENLLWRSFQKSSKIGCGFKRQRRGALPTFSSTIQARKHSKKLTKNAAQTLISSARMRENLNGGTCTKRKRILKDIKVEEGTKRTSIDNNTVSVVRKIRARPRSQSVSSNSSKPCSPSPSPVPTNHDCGVEFCHPMTGTTGKIYQTEKSRRRLDDAYDINNIVIPYSIASATRLEKLQYKEILTPKWRVMETKEEAQTAEEEDVSDEMTVIRHLKCEEDERHKFLSIVPGRSRARGTRVDSRADSSGANTPDPMSPAPADLLVQDSSSGWNSPVASPPPPNPNQLHATVSGKLNWNNSDEQQPYSPGAPLLLRSAERRRTISLSKRNSEDERLIFPPPAYSPFSEAPFTLPYEHRSFPLSEQDYSAMVKESPHLEEEEKVPASIISVLDEELNYGYPVTPPEVSSNGSLPDDDPNDPEWVESLGRQ